MNIHEAHSHKIDNSLFFNAPLKGWRGVWQGGRGLAKNGCKRKANPLKNEQTLL